MELPSLFRLSVHHIERLARWGTWLALLLLAHALAQLTWFSWPASESSYVGAGTPSLQTTTQAGPQRTGLETVTPLHLFGRHNVQAPRQAAAPVISAPETSLNLRLKGIYALSEDGSIGVAIIASGSDSELAYRVGEKIEGSAVVVHQIFADRVILDRGGSRYETLTLPRETFGTVPSSSGRQPTTGGSTTAPGRGQSNDGDVGQRLREYRQQIMANPMSALELVNIQPVMEGGNMKGYRVTPLQDPALFRSVGLRRGDIVLSVNGIEVADTARAGELMQALSSASTVTLVVERNGQRRNVSANFR